MKRTIVTMYLIGCCMFLLAQEKTINEIIDEAIECFCVYDKNCGNIDANNLEIEPIFRNGITYLYVVNTIKNGWVIVSNEKQYTQIIGHNNSGKFITDSVEMPCALRVLLNQHMNRIDSTRLEKKTIKKIHKLTAISNSSYRVGDSLLVYKGDGNLWGQRANNETDYYICSRSYNKFCPTFNSVACGHNLVGCSAVALGQILWYWNWPDYAMIHDSIKHNGDVLGNVRKHFYDWEQIPTKLLNYTSQYQADNIGKLLRDCGYAEHMLYRNTFSLAGLPKMKYAIENYFHFHYEQVHDNLIDDYDYLLINEINNLRPILCQAWETILSDAHSFVIDGYDSNCNFHINFGWLGTDNGFYDMGFNGFDNNRTFLTEIYPNCTARSDFINGINETNILADSVVTYYSTNDIVLNQTNSPLTIENGGHLITESGSSIILKPGFHAKAGSSVRLSIKDHCVTTGPYHKKENTDKIDYTENIKATENTELYILTIQIII